ncbi:hypothetical protein [Desulfosoma caldarium]|uniref:Uncharacterized protein n=1 Tax=Desulfosoma caldarium TaxID=610254 RepID=A0A3N1VHM8_9BACT|nr:hypothetical protein [Desulfosoma caldarium]ROR01519.1 hypothetical protein EDC27_0694 [Desulfosoma caldarium]
MSDAMKKVKPGYPLVIPAATLSAPVDSARDFLVRRHQKTQAGTPSGGHNCMVLVRNDSGPDRERFDVLGISGPVFDPASGGRGLQDLPGHAAHHPH